MRFNIVLLLGVFVVFCSCKSVPAREYISDNRDRAIRIGELNIITDTELGKLEERNTDSIERLEIVERSFEQSRDELQRIQEIIFGVMERGYTDNGYASSDDRTPTGTNKPTNKEEF